MIIIVGDALELLLNTHRPLNIYLFNLLFIRVRDVVTNYRVTYRIRPAGRGAARETKINRSCETIRIKKKKIVFRMFFFLRVLILVDSFIVAFFFPLKYKKVGSGHLPPQPGPRKGHPESRKRIGGLPRSYV